MLSRDLLQETVIIFKQSMKEEKVTSISHYLDFLGQKYSGARWLFCLFKVVSFRVNLIAAGRKKIDMETKSFLAKHTILNMAKKMVWLNAPKVVML